MTQDFKLNGQTSGKWILEGNRIILLSNKFDKINEIELEYL